MKFRDFLLKTILADTDYLVGYNADGEYIRVPKSALSAGAATPATLTVQYSANSSSWHNSYSSGDHYIRIKAGSGAWSGAIPLCVSAYDVWKQQGHSGTEEDFLLSLKGENGESADLSGLQLQNIEGYAAFLQRVNDTIANAKTSIIEDVIDTAVTNVMNQFTGLQLEDITEIRSLSDDDYLTVVTSDGLRKVKISSLSDNVAVRTVSTSVLEQSIRSQIEVLGITGQQNGENIDFVVSKNYVSGSSMLFLNGQRLALGRDYKETFGGFTMLTYIPEQQDWILFEAVPR